MPNRLPGFLLGALGITVLTTALALAQAKPAAQHFLPDVKIDQCFVQAPKLMSKLASGTQIVYENVGNKTYSSVTFLVGYRNSETNFLRRVVDQGTFAPGAKINHHFSLYNDVTYGGKATTSCGAISAQH
jgi:hypothetical protein